MKLPHAPPGGAVGPSLSTLETPFHDSSCCHLKSGNKFRKPHPFGNSSRPWTGGYCQMLRSKGQHPSIGLITSMFSRCGSPELADAELETAGAGTGRFT